MRFFSFNGSALSLLLLAGCGATQAEPVVSPVAPPLVAPPIVVPAPDDKAVPHQDAAPIVKDEIAPVEKELSLLEIFPVQPVSKVKRNQAGRDKSAAKVGANVVLTEPPSDALIAEKAAAGEVWVNAKSGAFHQPGTQYYGKTKSGFFLPEDEAIQQGFRGVKGQ